ncbi:hypothetical protein [Burkholderia diffusa]|uniref:hypothetical protein n=1 Tax=Burkholderia diffusa TaxID=488732 RepID=UPI0012DB398A|nr:hypothetical protein [Burkholderia diffusa]
MAYRECQAKFYRDSDIAVTIWPRRRFLAGYNAAARSPFVGPRATGSVFARTQGAPMAAVERRNDNTDAPACSTGHEPGGRSARGMAAIAGMPAAGTDLSGGMINTGIYR